MSEREGGGALPPGGGGPGRGGHSAPWRDGFGRELKAVARLAVPVVMVQLGMMLMGTVDTVMLGRYSAEAMAAGALGHSVSMSLLLVAWGILMAIDPLVAQAFGARDPAAIRAHLQRAVVLALALSLPLAAALWDLRWALERLGQQPAVAAGAALYMRALVPGVPAFLLFIVLRQTIQAMSIVRPAVVAIVVGNLVNAVANWALIYGRLGAPELGAAGAGWATSFGRWVLFAVLALAARPALAPYWGGFERRAAAAWRAHWSYLKLGLPIGLHFSLEVGVFTTVALLIGRLGIEQLGGHQIALNLAALSYMFPTGVAAAAATRVGNAIGRDDMAAARRAAAACLVLGVGAMACFALLFALAPRLLASLYSDVPGVVAMGAALIPIAAVFQVFDGAQAVGSGVLRGAADTRVPAALALIGYWLLGLPLGAWLAVSRDQGARGLWWGLTLGLASVAVLLLARIAHRFRGRIARVGAVT